MKILRKLLTKDVLQLFTPQLIEMCDSEFSGCVEVYKFQNKYFLRTGDVHQSGGWASTLFHSVSSKFKIQSLKLKSVMVLGVAGGSFIEQIVKTHPDVKIFGVDIDPVMIEMGKKYFGLDTYKNLKLKIADAAVFVKNCRDKFDLIFVDTFQGDVMPKELTSQEFLKNVLNLLKGNGHVIINRLYLPKHRAETDAFYQNLNSWQKEIGFKITDFFQNFGNKVALLVKC